MGKAARKLSTEGAADRIIAEIEGMVRDT
jgi:hypothetical protein